MLARRRLFRILEVGVRGPVTLISGPAGSGKTLLVTSWLRQGRWTGPVAWVSVQRGEHDAERFWTQVGDALRSTDASPRQRTPRGQSAKRVMDLLKDLAAPILLVLDDIDELRNHEAIHSLSALLAQTQPHLRVILLARRSLSLGLHRLRVAGDLTEIHSADLAFTFEETGDLLTAAGVALPNDAVRLVHERTDGWAVGLRLAAQALAESPDPARLAAEFSGTERTVAEYLKAEVIAGLPVAVRTMLTRTSVLDLVSGPLADALTGRSDGDKVLQDLEDANAFVVSVDPTRTWFRYHRLFRDVLMLALRREGNEQTERLHRIAVRWHEQHGSAIQAIRHAQSAGDWRYASRRLAQRALELCLNARHATFDELVARFPEHVLTSDAEFAALMAAQRVTRGRFGDADVYLRRAQRRSRSLSPARQAEFQVTLLLVTLAHAHATGDSGAVTKAAHSLLEHAHEERSAGVVASDDLQAVALMGLGFAELWADRLDVADGHLQDGMALASRLQLPYLTIGCVGAWAQLAIATRQFVVAEQRARKAIELASELGSADTPILSMAYAALGAALAERGLLSESEQWLDRAASSLARWSGPHEIVLIPFYRGLLSLVQGRSGSALEHFQDAERDGRRLHMCSRLATSLAAWQARAHIRLGDIDAAAAALADAGRARGDADDWCNVAAHLHLAANRPEAAMETLAPALAAADAGGASSVETRLLEALAQERLGEEALAERALERALDGAQSAGSVLILLALPEIRGLLERHPRHRTAHGALISDLLDHVSGVAMPPSDEEAARLHATLSPRERDILGLLPSNLTAAQIARELIVSVHTVKTHMRSLYAKLGVHRRADAVNRARDLGLLTRSLR